MNDFIKDAATRAINTFCQAVIGGIGSAVLIAEVSWPQVFSAAALATIVSILMSVVRYTSRD